MLSLACTMALVVILGTTAWATITLVATAPANMKGQAHKAPSIIRRWLAMGSDVLVDLETGPYLERRGVQLGHRCLVVPAFCRGVSRVVRRGCT
jgi:hypothetical protein